MREKLRGKYTVFGGNGDPEADPGGWRLEAGEVVFQLARGCIGIPLQELVEALDKSFWGFLLKLLHPLPGSGQVVEKDTLNIEH